MPSVAQNHPLDPRQKSRLAGALLVAMAVWQLNGLYLPVLAARGARALWAADLCQWVVLPAVLIGLLANVALLPRHYGLGISAAKPLDLAWKSVAVFVTAGLVFLVARNLSWRVIGIPAEPFQIAQHFPAGWMGTAAWLYAALSAGVVESMFFIGLPWLLYANTCRSTSPRFFMLATSTVFALAHWEQGAVGLAGAFFCHLVLCAWFLQWNTLWPVACGHTLIDLVTLA